jgi:outer membrane receptor protein involved in Fe transport
MTTQHRNSTTQQAGRQRVRTSIPMRSSLLATLGVLLLLPAMCFAQGTGVIYGTVTDASGGAVPGAQVKALLANRGMTRTGVTGNTGEYVFSAMPIGTYEITVTGSGFQDFRRANISLDANENVRVDASLTVGGVSQSVTVNADAPLVDSRSAGLGTLIEDRRLTELPTNGRNVFSLTALMPGVTQVSAPQTFTDDRGGPTVSMSGTRANMNLYLFDGQNYSASFRNTGLNYPPPDALQEVKVLTSNYSAEYGHNAGGVFNVVTKSGTNQLHGTLWEFIRNGAFNARNFFSPSNPQLQQNQFGAAAGGPIKKNKLFIFGSYEGLRVRSGSLATGAFPLTAAERQGDFSGQKAIIDPTTGKAFPDNKIPSSRFDTVAQNILSRGLMPLPNASGGSYSQVFPVPASNDQGLIRLDYNLGSKHLISGRYNQNYASEIAFTGQIPSYESVYNFARAQSATASDTYTVTSSVVNEFRLGYNRFSPAYFVLNGFSLADLGGNYPELNGMKIPPYLSISNRVTLGASSSVQSQIENDTYQLQDNVNWNRGKHFIKGGFEVIRRRYLNRTYGNTMGTFTLTGAITGNAAADFLIGKPATVTATMPLPEQGGVQHSFNQFIQDDWRVSRRLTLNFGLRYDLMLPWYQPQNYWATFHLGEKSTVFPNAPLGEVFYGDKGVPRGMIQTDKNNFAPRAGFAWDVFGNGRTSLRGGFGIFNNLIPAEIIQNPTTQPFVYTYTYNAPYSLSDPLRGLPPLPLTVDLANPTFIGLPAMKYPDPGVRTPYVEQFNLSVQREIIRDTVLEIAYVGKLGHKLAQSVYVNPASYGPGATLANLDQRRMIYGWGGNSAFQTSANSSYHALQVQAKKRFSHRFSLQGSYTYGKAISQFDNVAAGTPQAPQPLRLDLERGLATFNAKHVGSISWIADLPSLKGKPKVLRLIAGDWQWNGLFNARTGLPLNPVMGSDVALSGTPNQRPNVAGDWHLPSDRSRSEQTAAWFNTAAFVSPATGSYGNAGRDIIIAPGNSAVNTGLFKNIALPFREGMKLQFRTEFFNVLNQVNLGNPNVSMGKNMGKITSAGSPRILQFALKLLF